MGFPFVPVFFKAFHEVMFYTGGTMQFGEIEDVKFRLLFCFDDFKSAHIVIS